jgi:hypothetical protein
MTDEMRRPLDEMPIPDDGPGSEPGAASEPGPPPGDPAQGHQPKSPESREWLVQLQTMIDRIGAEAAPVARDVAAKAAELAAVAGEKAGPLARRAAEVTEDVGTRMAAKSRQLADELRHRGAESGMPPAGDDAPGATEPAAPEAPEAPDEGASAG